MLITTLNYLRLQVLNFIVPHCPSHLFEVEGNQLKVINPALLTKESMGQLTYLKLSNNKELQHVEDSTNYVSP